MQSTSYPNKRRIEDLQFKALNLAHTFKVNFSLSSNMKVDKRNPSSLAFLDK